MAAARLFVASGTLAYRQERGKDKDPVAAGAGDGSLTLPVALLTDNVGHREATPHRDFVMGRMFFAMGALFAMGFTDFRVRVREGGALLQFHRAQMEEARARRAEITEKLKPWFPVLLPDWEVR